jgi:mycothiol system anti-sigma-R factor
MNHDNSIQKAEISDCSSCSQCLQVLQIVLDGEASEAEYEFVQSHIQSCNHCFECYEVDKTLRTVVKEKILNINVPSDLVQLIEIKISELVVKA